MATTEPESVQSLRRAVAFGLRHGKTNMIAELAVLDWLFTRIDVEAACAVFEKNSEDACKLDAALRRCVAAMETIRRHQSMGPSGPWHSTFDHAAVEAALAAARPLLAEDAHNGR